MSSSWSAHPVCLNFSRLGSNDISCAHWIGPYLWPPPFVASETLPLIFTKLTDHPPMRLNSWEQRLSSSLLSLPFNLAQGLTLSGQRKCWSGEHTHYHSCVEQEVSDSTASGNQTDRTNAWSCSVQDNWEWWGLWQIGVFIFLPNVLLTFRTLYKSENWTWPEDHEFQTLKYGSKIHPCIKVVL